LNALKWTIWCLFRTAKLNAIETESRFQRLEEETGAKRREIAQRRGKEREERGEHYYLSTPRQFGHV
jgi:hypothetical protein